VRLAVVPTAMRFPDLDVVAGDGFDAVGHQAGETEKSKGVKEVELLLC